MFEGQPKGLWALALANTGERFGYYTMLAVFTLFLQANFGWSSSVAGTVYATFMMCVYTFPMIGGAAADIWGYSKMVTAGIFVMFVGYIVMSIPMGAGIPAVVAMFASLLLVCLGTGLFKGNLQVMVGDLYNEPKYADKRDSGFSLFYMLINVGAMFAPTAAIMIMDYAQKSLGYSEADSYHFAFGVACASLIVSIAIYYGFKSTFAHVITSDKKIAKADTGSTGVEEMSASETKERIICLVLVFAVVIFFWMAFHQNGATLTWFARDYSPAKATGITAMEMDVTNLVALIFIVFGLFGIVQNKIKGKIISALVMLAGAAYLGYQYYNVQDATVSAPIFQQFNPCFVIMLTPVSIGIFSWLGKKGREPKAPVKIGLGMLVAACAYLLMTVATWSLPAPDPVHYHHMADVTPNLLVSVYLIMTFAELLLSPIGISFVTKVAPSKYKGTMMGGWFLATGIGNLLVSIPTILWGNNLYVVWGTLTGICLLAALFIFSIIKKLNRVS